MPELQGEYTAVYDDIPAEESEETQSNDEIEVETTDVVEDDQGENELETMARSQGWRPQEEWEGNNDDWVDAKEFMFRGQLMERIQTQTKRIQRQDQEVEQLKQAMKALGEHNKKMAEIERNKALTALKRQKIAAMEDQDFSAAADIDDQMQELNQKEATTEVEESTPEVDPRQQEAAERFQTWVANPDNSWYSNDPVMRGAADVLATTYVQENPDASLDAVYSYMESTIKERFPDKFTNPNRNNPANVAGRRPNQGRQNKGAKYTERDLSTDQLTIGRTFVKSGAFESIQEYVDQLEEMGELPTQKGV